MISHKLHNECFYLILINRFVEKTIHSEFNESVPAELDQSELP